MAITKLRLDQLAVESFATGEGWDARGTVRGASGPTCDQDTCVTCPSDLDTCVSCNGTCVGTTCEGSCVSCPLSCYPEQCPSADGRC